MAEEKPKLTYRKLRGYKYDVWERFEIQTDIKTFMFQTPWYELMPSGTLIIPKRYAWDGMTDPGFDTPNTMIASLVHDVLYQAMREGQLDRSKREAVDQELRRISLDNGMSGVRAWVDYNFVRVMGKRYALPEDKPRGRIITI